MKLRASLFVLTLLGLIATVLCYALIPAKPKSKQYGPPLQHPIQSVIEKSDWTVEDTYGAGQYLVVGHDDKHMRLHCEAVTEQNDDGSYWYGGPFDCPVFQIGETLHLQKWQDDFYVRKKDTVKGDEQYRVVP